MTNIPDKVYEKRLKLQMESLESPSEFPGRARLRSETDEPGQLIQRKFCLQLDSLDSPAQMGGGVAASGSLTSPMTDLALNLCDTTLRSGLTPTAITLPRRLSMDLMDSADSPKLRHGALERSLSDSGTPLSSITNKPKRTILSDPNRLTALKSINVLGDVSNKENIPVGKQSILVSPSKRSPFKPVDSPLGLKSRKSPSGGGCLVFSPGKRSPGKGCARSAAVKRPMFTVLEEDEESRDSGYSSQSSQPGGQNRVKKKLRRDGSPTPSSIEAIYSNCSPNKVQEEGLVPLVQSPTVKHHSSASSSCSTLMSDGFGLDALSSISEEEDTESPRLNLTSLLSNRMVPSNKVGIEKLGSSNQAFLARQPFRRSQSLFNPAVSPADADSDSPISRYSAGFKRPAPKVATGPPHPSSFMAERSTSLEEQSPSSASSNIRKPNFVRSHSESDLKRSIQLKDEIEDILPDSSRLYCLPTIPRQCDSKHPSLRSISSHTLADLIFGVHAQQVASFRIIDVRYRFEFEGGHIQGAENWQHGEDEEFLSSFLSPEPLPAPPEYCVDNDEKRNILIFHCEFSSQRGPDFYKKLRERDRTINKDVYPALQYPECYLLHLGYKEFYKNYPHLCTGSYTEMADPAHGEELRIMRAKSKSWSGGTVARTNRMGRLHL